MSRLPTRPVYPDGDKVSRARAVAIRYETGKVFHLRGASGIDALGFTIGASWRF